MLFGLEFQSALPILASPPQRADVACFIGFVARRDSGKLPPVLFEWLRSHGWVDGPYARSTDDLSALNDIPIPIQSWTEFTALFNPLSRDWTGQGSRGSTYLAAAVRSFFTAGGRKCYVVRVSDPPQGFGSRLQYLEKLIPGYPGIITCSVLNPRSWRGIGHLFGLTDVSFVALPDIPDLVALLPAKIVPAKIRSLPEQFVECSQPTSVPVEFNLRAVPVPQCDAEGYATWAKVIHQIGKFVAGHSRLREIQLVAAVPMPREREGSLGNILNSWVEKTLDGDGLASAFIQLVYPWVQTELSRRLPAQLEPPDGLLVGTLAHNALIRGTFRSAANQPLLGVDQVFPVLGRSQQYTLIGNSKTTLLDRVSLIGLTAQGIRLLSDVTTSTNRDYRPACLNRLMSAIIRMARHTGEVAVFEASNERLWAVLRSQLQTLLLGFWNSGALRGASPEEAFEVRCDRTTTTQSDIDNGRIIVQVTVAPAQPITHITVMLSVTQSGVDSVTIELPALQEKEKVVR